MKEKSLNIEKVIEEHRQARLTVEYSSKTFEGFKRRAAKKIAKNSKIPGFRPGKAPYQVIVNRFGQDAILQEAIDLILENDYAKFIDQAEIEPSGPGSLEKIEQYDPPKFVFVVPLEPEVSLGDYREVRKPYDLEEFDVRKVDEFIDKMRRNAATIVPAEHPAGEGDLVYFTLSGEFLNPDKDQENNIITEKTPQQIVIPSGDEETGEQWPYPGFAQELIGTSAGDIKEVQYTYPEDHENEDYQGKRAIFTAEIQSVKALELPELDDDFIKTMGDFESAEDFRAEIEARLRNEHQSAYEQTYFNDLLNEITENAELDYPPQMLEHEKEHILEDIKGRLENQNMDFETYLKLRDTEEEAFIEEEIRPIAKQRLERSLIVDALIDAEGLKINQELLKQNIGEIMNDILISGNADTMQKELGQEAFSRAISMEGVERTMNAQVHERLKLIATGKPIPEDNEETQTGDEEIPEETEQIIEKPIVESSDVVDELEDAGSEDQQDAEPQENVEEKSSEKVSNKEE